jgi:predicted nuclease of restriction endonuclease-like (RecB) superfamily
MKNKHLQTGYGQLLIAIKERIRKAQHQALKAVHREQIDLYWDIGRMIVERQKKYGWGKAVVETLARDLRLEFPGALGFSVQNLWYMRQFYSEYSANSKLQPLVGEISWAKHLVIMAKCKNPLEREFYIRMTHRSGWTKNILIHQIENHAFEKIITNQTNFEKSLPPAVTQQAKLAVKDEYVFDFLELRAEHSERQLEKAVLAKIDRFLLEMGGAIAFAGSQYRLEVGGKEYFIDLLLYHRHLRCLVAVELKAGEFVPEYVGKMQFYLAALDDTVKVEGENPAIGIIVCKSKEKLTVEYALRVSGKPISVATYRITSHLPHDLKKELPGPEQIAHLPKKI